MKFEPKKWIQFMKESYTELKKVSWLSKKEMIASTIVTIVIVLIVAIYVGLVDFFLSRILSIFF